MAKKNAITRQKSAAVTREGLTLQQEEFCQMYVNADRELFGNGTRCYMEVYNRGREKKITYKSAQVLAHKELTKVKIIDRINNLLSTGGFNDENVDKQHLFLINQHADLKTKMAAIREFNALKKRISPQPISPTLTQFNFYNVPLTDIRRSMEGIISRGAGRVSSATESGDLSESEE